MTALLTFKINMVKVGQGPHLNTVSKMLRDARKTGVEFRLVLPTLGHDMVPGERQEFVPPMAVKDLPPWTALHIHTGPGEPQGGSICPPPVTTYSMSGLVHPG